MQRVDFNCVFISTNSEVVSSYKEQSARYTKSFLPWIWQYLFCWIFCELFGHRQKGQLRVFTGRYILAQDGRITGVEGEQCTRCRHVLDVLFREIIIQKQ